MICLIFKKCLEILYFPFKIASFWGSLMVCYVSGLFEMVLIN